MSDLAYHVYRVDTSRRERAWMGTFQERTDAASFLDGLHKNLSGIERKNVYYLIYSENINAEQVKLESP